MPDTTNIPPSILLSTSILGPMDIRSFGAVADGSYQAGTGTDNTTAIQNAINACAGALSSGVNTVLIPSGKYCVNSQLTIPAGVFLVGDGPWSSMIFCPSTFSSATGLLRFNGVGGPPCGLRSLAVVAGAGTQTGAVGINFAVNGCWGEDIWTGGFGIDVLIGGTASKFINFVVDAQPSNGVGIKITTNHVLISNGEIFDRFDGILVTNPGGDKGEVIIDNVEIHECINSGVTLSAANNVMLSSVVVYGSTGTANANGGFIIDGCADVSLSSCQAKQAVVSSGTNAHGIAFTGGGSSRVDIIDFSSFGFYRGIYGAVAGNDVQIIGGLISGCVEDGIKLHVFQRCFVRDVLSRDNGGNGFTATNSGNDNTFDGCFSSGNTGIGISVATIGGIAHTVNNCQAFSNSGGNYSFTGTIMGNDNKLQLVDVLEVAFSYNAGTINNGASATSPGQTVVGALIGDYAIASCTNSTILGLGLIAVVDGPDSVKLTLINNTGGGVTLGATTWKIRVLK